MNPLDLGRNVLLVSSAALNITAIYFIVTKFKKKKQFDDREKEQKQKMYHATVLQEIQDKIGYSLDTEQVAEIIIKDLKEYFSYSTASILIVKDDQLTLKTKVEKPVSRSFVSEVTVHIKEAITALGIEEKELKEEVSGIPLDDTNSNPPKSFFNIPLIINNKIRGLINVSEDHKNAFTEKEMDLMFKIAAQACHALTRLMEVIETDEERLMAMIKGLADGVFMVDRDKNVLNINNAARTFLKIKDEDVSFFDILTPIKSHYDLVDKIDEVFKSGCPLEKEEIEVGEKTVQIFVTPVTKPENGARKVIGASILLHDVTLEKEIAKIKEDFTHMMVHEIRAPLTSIRASSELLMGDGITKEKQKEILKIINEQSAMLLEQVGSILDAAKIESGKFVIQKEVGDINKIVTKAVNMLKPLASEKNIEIEEALEKIPEFAFDNLRMSQVLNNFLSNSLKFTPEHGKILVSSKLEEGNVVLAVKDNGKGIAKEELGDLFSKYYQARTNSSEQSKKGTGLGLYIVKGIVEAHGGKVWAESEIGQGTTMLASIPANNTSQTQAHSITHQESPSVTTSTSPV